MLMKMLQEMAVALTPSKITSLHRMPCECDHWSEIITFQANFIIN